ncbi:hypothetical protein Bbelb_242630 [Branchiostoma belcheri]|nr:hypothetical protein Bbelb_242630 [Branchiostoma belcheri]
MKLFQSIVVPTAVYACESWRSPKETVEMLDTFQRRCLRTILGISWRDHVSNAELMQRAKVPPLSAIKMKRILNFAGHVWKLPDLRTTKTALTWKPEGTRPSGRPRVTLRKTLQNDGAKLGFNSLKDMVVVTETFGEINLDKESTYATRLREDVRSKLSGWVQGFYRPAHTVADMSCTHWDTPGHVKFHGTCTGPKTSG